MNIIPSSIVSFYRGIGFDSTYANIRWFRNTSEQNTYMTNHLHSRQENCTYIRHDQVLRVPNPADYYYDVDYCAFQNYGFSEKLFFAFVTDVEYVNSECTHLHIQIDLVQTWMFEFNIGKCFVEREHVSDDTVGKHTIPENLPFGDLVVHVEASYPLKPVGVLVRAPESGVVGTSEFVNNIYSPLMTIIAETPAELNAQLEEIADQPEKLAMLKMGTEPISTPKTAGIGRAYNGFTFAGDSYTPVNNKLYCYPYCLLYVDDYGANSATFKWEDFAQPHTATFEYTSQAAPYPIGTITPRNYKGMDVANSYMIVKTDYPDCPYIIDNFRAWSSSVGAKQALAEEVAARQKVLNNVSDFVSNLSSGVKALTGNPGAAGGGVVNMLGGYTLAARINENQEKAQQISHGIDEAYAYTHGSSVGGQVGGVTANWTKGLIGWRMQDQRIKPEYARMIDQFFTRFGYKVNLYKTPNLFTRSTFNYVKTVSANITGSVPDDASALLANIFNTGATLWHTNDIGNYSLVNAVVEEDNE